jgi:hypothetical protein
VPDRGVQRADITVDQLGRIGGLAELLLRDRVPEVVGDLITPVVHRLRGAVQPDGVQRVPGHVRGAVHDLPGQMLRPGDRVADRRADVVEQIHPIPRY